MQTPRGLVTLAAPGRYGVVAGDTQTPTDGHGDRRLGPGRRSRRLARCRARPDGEHHRHRHVPGRDRSGAARRVPHRDAGQRAPPPQQAAARGRLSRRRRSWQQMPGGDDLAQYGSWSESPDYGQVWYPQVAQDWVPYRDGSWAYVAPWGWTWVDSAPWGFAPFHYGRWAEIGGRWGWIPGGGDGGFRRPVYAPALVTFLGVGAVAGVGVGAALAAGRIGWLPLGPREPFHPWYRASDRYFRQVNGGARDQLHHDQPQRHVQQLRQSPRRDGGADQRDDRLATGGDLVPAGRSGAACAGAAGDRPAAAAPGARHRGRDPGGRPPVEPAAAVAGHARRSRPARRSVPRRPASSTGPRGRGGGSPGLPLLHNPGSRHCPVTAGAVRPFAAPPALRTPAGSRGRSRPPAIQREPGVAGPGGDLARRLRLVNRGGGLGHAGEPSRTRRRSSTPAPGATFQQAMPPGAAHAPPGPPPSVTPRDRHAGGRSEQRARHRSSYNAARRGPAFRRTPAQQFHASLRRTAAFHRRHRP